MRSFYAISSNYKSAIDITFTNAGLAPSISLHWDVLENLWGSDHFPISIELECFADRHLPFNKSYRLHGPKTDWERIISQLSAISEELLSIACNS